MGTTVDKGEYLNTTKSLIAQEINNLGGSIDNQTTFREYSEQLNDIYENVPKTDFETGESITIENCLKGKLNFQDGINLIENNLTSQSANGLTITVDKNKNITINGTASASTTINLLNNTSNNTAAAERTLPAGTYQLTGCPSGSNAGTKFKLDVLRSGYIALLDNGNGDIKTLTSSQTYTYIRIQIFSGTICNNLVFKPRLIKVQDTEKRVVGIGQTKQVTTSGKNLFNITNYTNITSSTNGTGTTVTKQPDSITIVSGSTTSSGFYIVPSNWQSYVQGYSSSNTYTLSADVVASADTTFKLGVDGSSSTSITANTLTRLSATFSSGSIVAYNTNGTAGITIKLTNIMISSDNTTIYEQYSGGYSSPSPNWQQTINGVRGRNKLPVPYTYASQTRDGITFTVNDDGSIKANGTATGNATFVLQFQTPELRELLLNNECMLSGCPSGGSSSTYKLQLYGWTSSGTGSIVDTGNGVSLAPFENTSSNFNIAILILTGTTVNNIVFKPMLEIGNEVHSYVPYNTVEETMRGKNWCNLLNSNPSSSTNINVSLKTSSSLLFNTNGETVQDAYNIFDSFNLPKIGTLPKGKYIFVIEYVGDCTVTINTIASYLKTGNSASSGTIVTCTNTSGITNGTRYGGVFTLDKDTDVYLQIYTNNQNKQFTNTEMRFMIYKGDYTTSEGLIFQPYKVPKTYQFSLGTKTIYKDCYIVGTPNNWKFVDNYGIKVFDGTGDNKFASKHPSITSQTKGFFQFGLTYKDKSHASGSLDYIYCQYLQARSSNAQTAFAQNDTGLWWEGGSTSSYAILPFTTLADANNWLVELNTAGNPLKMIYLRSAPVETPITDNTLITQLNNWYYAQSFEDTTTIEGDGDLPMIIDIAAIKKAS